ncbi:MAG: hypothetical protein JWO38_3486 [Gemmataceae bacterium]|nr:hypothetical protein [Gemmataceae bacterium]
MLTTTFDAKGFIRTMIDRGWRWGGVDETILLHPTNHDFYLRYDELTDKLTLSPQLNAHLDLVIPTPPGKSKTFR